MNRFQIRVAMDEFPFVEDLIEQFYTIDNTLMEEIDEIKVERIDRNLLDYTPKSRTIVGEASSINDHEEVCFVDSMGEPFEFVQSSYTAIRDGVEVRNTVGETVGEGLVKLKSPDDVAYIAKIAWGYRIEHNRSRPGVSVTLYKAPKGFTIQGWFEEQLERERKYLQAQLADIDSPSD